MGLFSLYTNMQQWERIKSDLNEHLITLTMITFSGFDLMFYGIVEDAIKQLTEKNLSRFTSPKLHSHAYCRLKLIHLLV
jgi:hypothetical protein